MAHGTPDWGLVGPKSITYGLDDLGEAVVRLGSPQLWDRRGDVLALTDFREGLGHFYTDVSGVGAEVLLCTGHSRSGAYSVCLRAGSGVGRYALIHAALPFQDPSCVGMEFSFSVANWTESVRAYVEWYDGTNRHYAWALYDHVLSQLAYQVHGVGWVVAQAGVALHQCTRPEHTFKLVVDMSLGEYLRFLVDELAPNVRGAVVPWLASAVEPYWYFAIWHTGAAGWNPDVYIDNVIITQNEPR